MCNTRMKTEDDTLPTARKKAEDLRDERKEEEGSRNVGGGGGERQLAPMLVAGDCYRIRNLGRRRHCISS